MRFRNGLLSEDDLRRLIAVGNIAPGHVEMELGAFRHGFFDLEKIRRLKLAFHSQLFRLILFDPFQRFGGAGELFCFSLRGNAQTKQDNQQQSEQSHDTKLSHRQFRPFPKINTSDIIARWKVVAKCDFRPDFSGCFQTVFLLY